MKKKISLADEMMKIENQGNLNEFKKRGCDRKGH